MDLKYRDIATLMCNVLHIIFKAFVPYTNLKRSTVKTTYHSVLVLGLREGI